MSLTIDEGSAYLIFNYSEIKFYLIWNTYAMNDMWYLPANTVVSTLQHQMFM